MTCIEDTEISAEEPRSRAQQGFVLGQLGFQLICPRTCPGTARHLVQPQGLITKQVDGLVAGEVPCRLGKDLLG